jgi:hypothetical protein
VTPEIKKALRTTLNRARGSGRKFNLRPLETFDLYRKQQGLCAVTGLPFDDTRHGETLVRPFIPSLDRIDARKGYVRGNVRLVLAAVNFAIGQWGSPLFITIARAAVKQWELTQALNRPISDNETEPKDTTPHER